MRDLFADRLLRLVYNATYSGLQAYTSLQRYIAAA